MRLQIFGSFFLFFVTSTSSFYLECTSMTGELGYISTKTYCHVHSLTITSKNEKITSVNGVSTPTSFEGIFFRELTVHYLPKGIGEFFPSMRELWVEKCGLKTIEASDLQNLASLESLGIPSNAITELSSDLLKFTPKIQFVSFYKNQISMVGEDLFKNFNSLKRLNFRHNNCIDSETTSDFETFKATLRTKCPHPKDKYCYEDSKKYEEEISALKAELIKVKRDCYHGLLDSSTKLLYEMSKKLKNHEKDIEQTSFLFFEQTIEEEEIIPEVLNSSEDQIYLGLKIASQESKIVKIVDFSGNEVQPNQTELVIDQQNTLFLPRNLGQIFSSLQKLLVTFSGLFSLDARTFNNMDKIVFLNFTGNKIIEIPEEIFSELKSVQEIDLSQNNIQVINENAFIDNDNLAILKLNHNQLATIDGQLFKNNEKLKKLFLNDNKLKFINAELLSPSKALEVVDLFGNLCIDVSSTNATVEKMTEIIIENCIAPVEIKCKEDGQLNENTCKAEDLTLISPGTKLLFDEHLKRDSIENLSIVNQKMLFMPSKLSESLPNLTELTIIKSELKSLQKGDFEGLSKLEKLAIEHNKITKIAAGIFDAVPLITNLNLGQNQISLIEKGVFDAIPLVVYLNLAHNNIELLPSEIFNKLMKLETLILAGNHLKKFRASFLPPRGNAIKDFQLQENKLKYIDSKVLKLVKNADLVDLSGNFCIKLKYQKSDESGRTLKDMIGDVEYDCDDDSSEENKIK